jgi:hypothetical protein
MYWIVWAGIACGWFVILQQAWTQWREGAFNRSGNPADPKVNSN